MEHELSTTTIFINIVIQVVNLLLFFLLFKYLFGWKIIRALQERKILITRLQDADDEYKNIILQAEIAAKDIISWAQDRKKIILEEAHSLAVKKADEILVQATNKAEDILTTAKAQADIMNSDLKNNYEIMVKATAWSYLKKIFDKEPDLQQAYMHKVMKGLLGN